MCWIVELSNLEHDQLIPWDISHVVEFPLKTDCIECSRAQMMLCNAGQDIWWSAGRTASGSRETLASSAVWSTIRSIDDRFAVEPKVLHHKSEPGICNVVWIEDASAHVYESVCSSLIGKGILETEMPRFVESFWSEGCCEREPRVHKCI